MKYLEPFYKETVLNLLKHKVEFLLIGGLAVNYYGYARYTGDMDIWLKPDDENKNKLVQAMLALGRNAGDIEYLAGLDFSKHLSFYIGEGVLRIDFLNYVNQVGFEEAWNQKQEWPLENALVPIVNYHHLILTKINTGRTKDKLDIEELQKVNRPPKND